MSWVTPTTGMIFEDDSQELAGIVAVKTADDRDRHLGDVVAEFRGAIAARGTALDAEGSVPRAFQSAVINLALWRFISVGVAKNEGLQTKPREAAAKSAESLLESIRNGQTAIEPPEGWSAGRGGYSGSDRPVPGRMGCGN